MIYFDQVFKIGSSHTVCEDYALTSQDFAALADGCSSGTASDVVARLQVHLAAGFNLAKTTPEDPNFGKVYADYLAEVERLVELLGLTWNQSFATLTVLTLSEDRSHFHVLVVGDGSVVARRKDGGLEGRDFDHAGAPYYLTYQSRFKFADRYRLLFPADHTIKRWGKKEGVITSQVQTFPKPVDFHFFTFDRKEYDLVACFSDGIDTFFDEDTVSSLVTQTMVPAQSLIDEFLDFKTLNGVFVNRRWQGFQRKYPNRKHSDDFSMICAVDDGE